MDIISAFGGWCGGTGFWQGGPGPQGWMPFHFGGIFQILVIGLIGRVGATTHLDRLVLGLLVFLVARMFRQQDATGEASPREILKRRYASGEIDKETFHKIRDELK